MGAKEKAMRKQCKVKGLPKEPHEGGGQEVVTSGYGVSEDVGSACSGFGPYRKIGIEEADGSSSGEKEHSLKIFVHGSIWP